MTTKRKLRIAVIGCGMIHHEHMEAFAGIPEAEIVAAVDIRPERTGEIREKFNLPETACYADWRKMLAEVKPDAVDICLPNHLHAPAALDAIAAGCHVYVEKPMAMSVAECETMIAAARKADRKLAVGFQQEYCPNTQLLVNAREQGFFGEFRYFRGLLLRRRGIPGYGVFHIRDCGGGPLLDLAVHLLDVMTYVAKRPRVVRIAAALFGGEGKRPSEVFSTFTLSPEQRKDYDVEDLAAAQITFESGAVLQLTTSYVNHIKEDCVYEFSVTGTTGGARWAAGAAPELYCDKFGAMMNLTPAWLPSLGRPDMFRKKLDNFVRACREGSELLLPGEQGLYVQRILDGIFAAAKAGREIELS